LKVASTYIPGVTNEIAIKLFGEESLGNGMQLPYPFRGPVQVIGQQSWALVSKQYSRSKVKLASLEASAKMAFEGAFFFLRRFELTCH